MDAQWNPHLHCFPVPQQNSFWKGKTTACYTVWPLVFQTLQSWSKEESQITGRKLKTITPISIFVLWKLRSRVASLRKGWWHFPCQAFLKRLGLTGRHQEKRPTAGFANLSVFLGSTRKYWCPCLLHLYLTGLPSCCIDNIMSNFWLPNADKDQLSIKKVLVLCPCEDGILIKNIHHTD